jgi:uncharacterized protein (TIGR00369 family)
MAYEGKDNTKAMQLFWDVYDDEKAPFNKMLGFRLESVNKDGVCFRFEMREELIGNYVEQILHGGVISSALDTAGGVTALVAIIKEIAERQTVKKLKRIPKTGTIDLRVDYLRPGKGKYFLATGSIMRMGRKVAVTRMELHNDQGLLIAVGTGTYIVG